MIVVPIHPAYGDYSVLPPVNGKAVSGLKADLDLILITPNESEILFPFRIDPGAICSTMSLVRAERLGLFRPDDVITELKLRTASGEPVTQTVRIGKLVVRLPALRANHFEWPVLFIPTKPISNPPQLGLAGVISDLTFYFDGTPNTASAYGSVTVTLRIPDNHSS